MSACGFMSPVTDLNDVAWFDICKVSGETLGPASPEWNLCKRQLQNTELCLCHNQTHICFWPMLPKQHLLLRLSRHTDTVSPLLLFWNNCMSSSGDGLAVPVQEGKSNYWGIRIIRTLQATVLSATQNQEKKLSKIHSWSQCSVVYINYACCTMLDITL